jgi:glycosyltransferase involved in cell wall biosynthesis
MPSPTVSFIVPCYKLAHLLPECINSILCQSYADFEVLVMDDCSPDNTPEVACSFEDRRVQHIRNEPNLGHLRNYNKGIRLARGKYIWLISADDYLRSREILRRYVEVLEAEAQVGYAFCPGFGVGALFDTQIMGRYSARNDRDRVLPGHVLLKKLLRANFVLAASGMARRECYDKISLFPLDMPWAGDWYLWSVFALHFDVAYFSEPMVCYRKHELSMTNALFQKSARICCEEDVAVLWRVKEKADDARLFNASTECLNALGEVYARNIASTRYGMSSPSVTFEEFEDSLSRHDAIETERTRVRARVYAAMGNEYYWQGDFPLARKFYRMALAKDPWQGSLYLKALLLHSGRLGERLRNAIYSFRNPAAIRPKQGCRNSTSSAQHAV